MGCRVKEFEVPLTGEFYLLVRIESLRGRVSGFVVLLIKTQTATSISSATTRLTDNHTAICSARKQVCCEKTGWKG
ncbi:MAG: hypothetical protein AAB393_14050 [Bacteroidota bacterium]